MSPIYEPAASKVQGFTRVWFVTTLATPSAPSLASEINAASTVEATMAMYGSFNPQVNVNTGNAPARLGTTEQLPVEGNAQLQPIQVAYPYDPSQDDTGADNKLKALLTQGTELYAVVRKGIAKDTDPAAAQVVEVYQLVCGYQNLGQTGDDEFAEFNVQQNLFQQVSRIEGAIAA